MPMLNADKPVVERTSCLKMLVSFKPSEEKKGNLKIKKNELKMNSFGPGLTLLQITLPSHTHYM